MSCRVDGCTEPAIKRARCRVHYNEYYADIIRRMRERSPDRFKGYTLKRDYGISLEDYELLLFLQEGKCAVCGALDGSERSNNNGSKRLSVDHAHGTGIIRGLLCSMCNKGIGSLLDSPELLRKAAVYLETARDCREKLALVKVDIGTLGKG